LTEAVSKLSSALKVVESGIIGIKEWVCTCLKKYVIIFERIEKQTPEGYISKDIYHLIYILKSPKKDIFYHFLEKDILGI
jgi:hypothetical protein